MTTPQPMVCRISVSWRSIFAGVITALAISIVLAVLGMALGFTVFEPTSDEPLSGMGIAFGIWSFISVVLSLGAGGYIAGFFSGAKGLVHGFLVWATVLIVATFFSAMAISTAVRTVGSAVQTVASGAAGVASSVGSGIADITGEAVSSLQESVSLDDIDPQAFNNRVTSVLRDTEVETLQPEYLRGQMREARSDLRNMLNQLRLNSSNHDQIINDFLDKQQNRLEAITQDVDRNAAVNALVRNSGMTRPEAEDAVDNAIATYNRAVADAKTAITEARQQIEDTRVYLQNAAEQARVKAEELSNAAARSALIAALALILGAVVSGLAGRWGIKHSLSCNI